ncbi:hypothetical protein PMI26_00323, partial [Pseudomonas sp. GM33]
MLYLPECLSCKPVTDHKNNYST